MITPQTSQHLHTAYGNRYRVALVHKNFAAIRGVSHIGLGVAALNTAKVLQSNGIAVDVWTVLTAADLEKHVAAAIEDSTNPHVPPLTHVIVSAPWINTSDWQHILSRFRTVQFSVVCHSNIPFLNADPQAVQLMRDALMLEQGNLNFQTAGNSEKFNQFIRQTYKRRCWFLPNLYFLDETTEPNRPVWSGDLLRIGCFGANRVLKNATTAGAASLELAARLRVDLELYVNAGRAEGGNMQSLRELFAGVRSAKLIEINWESWPQFRRTVAHMDLLMQPSFTESFNMVTADGVAESVPSVVGDAIDWAPCSWKANIEDTQSVVKTAIQVLHDRDAARDGFTALTRYVSDGVQAYLRYFRETTPHF